MDKSLGDILDFLDAKGIAGEAIVLFMSDNGGLRLLTWQCPSGIKKRSSGKLGSSSRRISNTSRKNGMRTLVSKESEVAAADVRFDKEMMHVRLKDGREISVPLEWFPKLRDASTKQRKNWRLIGKGVGIRWPDLDEDVSVSALLK